MEDYVIVVEDAYVVFESLSGKVFALKGANLRVGEGEHICITGPSGSGKTTFLNLIYGVVKPFSGAVRVLNKDLSSVDYKELVDLRSSIGFATQEGLFIDHLTIMENMYLKHASRFDDTSDFIDNVVRDAGELGIEEVLTRFPDEISVGERKRAEILLAIFDGPPIALIDEPTAMLDSESVDKVLKYITRKTEGSTLIVTTHDPRVYVICESVYELIDGKLYPKPSK